MISQTFTAATYKCWTNPLWILPRLSQYNLQWLLLLIHSKSTVFIIKLWDCSFTLLLPLTPLINIKIKKYLLWPSAFVSWLMLIWWHKQALISFKEQNQIRNKGRTSVSSKYVGEEEDEDFYTVSIIDMRALSTMTIEISCYMRKG